MDDPSRISVVIVDDTEAIRRLVKLVLELERDITVVGEAANGREGVDVAAAHEPDVVLLDISMPEMDGIEALPHIRSSAPRSRILMLTGFGSPEIRERCARLGAAGFLDKGVIAGAIVAEVRRVAAEAVGPA